MNRMSNRRSYERARDLDPEITFFDFDLGEISLAQETRKHFDKIGVDCGRDFRCAHFALRLFGR